MDESVGEPLDRWADWLLHGRRRGLSEADAEQALRQSFALRERVLDAGRLQPGQRVLDVGAGTGFLTLQARRRVGPSGWVVALDLSRQVLHESRRQAQTDEALAPLELVVGEARHLPFPDGWFDRVLTSSVLTYVADKGGAARELHRVLRPGGRVSIMERIQRVTAANRDWGLDLSSLQPAHAEVLAYLEASSVLAAARLGFDERGLVRCFVEAGFASVDLSYFHSYSQGLQLTLQQALLEVRHQPNPCRLSYDQAARAVLGHAAGRHLANLCFLLLSRPVTLVAAEAFITADR